MAALFDAYQPAPVAELTPLAPAADPLTGDYGDHLTKVVRYFEESEETTQDARKLSERDRDYYDNDQWTAEELAILRKRKQPALTINYIKRKVQYMRGSERRMRSDPKAFPRTREDEEGANAATDALRFVSDQNDFDETRSSVYENMIIEGFGGCDVIVETRPNGEVDVVVTRVPWDRLFYDPHSRMGDFSDAKYKGIVIWMDKAEAIETYGNTAAVESTFLSVTTGETYGDRPRNWMWCDTKRARVRVVQIHYQEAGEWMIATYTKGGFLIPPQVSPYKDKWGKSASSLVMRSAYVDRDNNRYGDVRDLISMQDEINKRRSKALHLMNVRQTYGNAQGVADANKAREQLARPDGHVELGAGSRYGEDFGVIPTGDMAVGQMQLLQHVTGEMQAAGPNAAMAGKDPRQQSGRAIQAQQQGGSVELEPSIDDLRQWARDVYEAVWLRIKDFWTDEKWVRVTDDERNIKWVGLNKKVTVADRIAQMQPEKQQQALMVAAQYFGMLPDSPELLEQVIGIENDVSGLDVDITIEEGPDLSTLQTEQFQILADLAKAGIPIPPKAIIQASSIRNKDAILDEMEEGKQLPPEVQKQMQEMRQALEQAQQQLQQKDMQLQDKAMEYEFKGQELELKRGELALKQQTLMKPDAQQPADPVAQELDAAKKIADIGKVQADTEQTEVETALLITAPEPEFKGSVSA